MLHFKILGIPRPKQSFRFTKQGRKYQTKEIVEREASFATQIASMLENTFVPLDCPIEMKCLYVFPFPSAFSKKNLTEAANGKLFYKDTKPDITDNLNKGVSDAMEGVVFINDSRVCKFSSEKIYGDTPRTEIWITTI